MIENESYYRYIFETSQDAIFILNMEGKFQDANPATSTLLGYSLSELEQMNISDFVFKAKSPHLNEHENIWQLGGTAEMAVRNKNGETKTVDFVVSPFVRGQNEKHVMAIARDITAARQIESKAQRLLEQQIAVNQLTLSLGETRDLEKIYDTIYQHIRKLVDAWAFIVSFYEEENQLIRAGYVIFKGKVIDVSGFPLLSLSEPGQGTQSQVIRSGEVFYAPNHRKAIEKSKKEYIVDDEGGIRDGPPEKDEDEDSAKSSLYIPMKIEGRTIGVMQLQSTKLDAYSEEDIQLLTGLANVAAIAFQNARLFQAVEEELHERERAETALRGALQKTETLNQELFHRTKNSMQVIISILMLQSSLTDDARITKVLKMTQGRILSMVLAQDNLYKSRDLSSIRLDDYVRSLTDELIARNRKTGTQISVVFELEEISALIDIAIPCGLILHELLVNALEHAFTDGDRNQIQLQLHRSNSNEITLAIWDNGVGLPEDFDLKQTDTYGLQVVSWLAEHQLQGRFRIAGKEGTKCSVQFRNDLYQERI